MIHQEYALSERVHLTGYLDCPQIAAYLNAADVFVLSSFFEGWPTAMVEALATGKAIVSTSVGAAAELIDSGKNGYIVDSRDPQSFGKAMVEALSLDAHAHSLHKARPYTLEGLAEDLGRLWAPLRPRQETPQILFPMHTRDDKCVTPSCSFPEGMPLVDERSS